MHFGENQISPSVIRFSRLSTAHPRVLQHPRVRSSSPRERAFNLAMDSSLGFGSTPCNLAPSSDSLSLRLRASSA